ncbi:MAG: hypothetical protein Q7J34_01080 [Bacteroidales bacterium]|nr:hypothetical protein [Bacteroidales bacterium]
MIKKLLIRLAIILALVFVFNLVYKNYFLKDDLMKIPIYDSLQSHKCCSEILYLAESSNLTVANTDTDRRRISDMISDYYPGLEFGTVNYGAIHGSVYYKLMENIPDENRVKTLIITLNMRSFGADWIYSKLESLLQRDNVMMDVSRPPLINRFFLGLKAYDNRMENERREQVGDAWEKNILRFPYDFPYRNVNAWDRALADGSFKKADGSWDMPKIQLATSYVKTYGFQIDTLSNPRIADFDKIVEYAHSRGWNIVLNLLAENVEKAKELAGKDLIYLMQQNRDLLVKRYTRMGALVVDNLEAVPSEQFIDSTWTTEHYAEKGRKIIAQNVAEAMRIYHPDKYIDGKNLPVYICNFDVPSPQFSAGNPSTDISRSGKQSCLLTPEFPYSASFRKLHSEIDTSNNGRVRVSAWVSTRGNIGDLKLVVSFENEKTGLIKWNGNISDAADDKIPSWKYIEVSHEIPTPIREGDFMKIYVWYTGNDKAYTDDLRVEFVK